MDKQQVKRKETHWDRYLNRLNILLVLVFAGFALLIFRLGYLQLVNGQTFEELVHLTETNVAKEGVPRGYIVDRDGHKLVDNEGLQAIGYTRGKNTSGEDMAKTARRLADFIEMDTEALTERDLKDYWAASHEDELNDRLSSEEKRLKGGQLYDAQLNHIQSEDLDKLSDQDKEAAAIYKQMNSAYAFSTTLIKHENVTNEEVARVSEHSADLPGVTTTIDWKRVYPEKDLLRSVLGSVTTEKEGLPSHRANRYLAKGYARNDRVGQSYLEEMYEADLRGAKAKYETEVNQNGELVQNRQKYSGDIGNTLRLTIDTNLQKQVEAIAEDYLENKSTGENNQIYVVATDPRNGEVLALGGKRRGEDGKLYDDALGTINASFEMGSTVKGATIAAGYYYDVLEPGADNTFVDQAMNFSGTPIKASWWHAFDPSRRVVLDDRKALAVSSNVYMIRVAMAIGGMPEYTDGMSLVDLDPNLGNKLRHVYAQFGLGVETGIDLQNESTGLNGGDAAPGNYLDMSFGQFDTYTPMQLNQYVATIANGGKRYAPHLMKSIEKTDTSPDAKENFNQLIYKSQPRLLNEVQVDPAAIQAIQEGFRAVVADPDGLSHDLFGGFPVPVAAKTGTAETNDRGIVNSTFVAYAPYDNPRIAISIVIPAKSSSAADVDAQSVGYDVLAAYFGQGSTRNEADGDQEASQESSNQ
ncbi:MULTISPECIES: penicillin-binding transpeptidase domain-containing protein [unclassified Aerococcus]|uniref:penicillin-binding transpeptidase domain-containing protein n=1 Tax=unclassified Aerococcus TaxID=2618060 RepID=UPI0008A1DDA1|nr:MULTISPECIES: penicillin-binding transpeptidase domain-containing protein [unclassified Aerococcus]MDK6679530.1 penicillin-binding transpeptidase domain-containing protein [Aerococcus sp. UMB8608]MDK6686374.1 penicillin-binding transpeptidase domain-containing protein [Aerococcus sp. UMB8623]MDK6941004.1 penicillin-binding transpeptidase domain-containing protein [Aerococcus sp. UMB8487]OFK21051.1 hypothetical protein HMPREF2829_06145 [Aerococcus sp. HMSC072A12]OFR31981.1 hypothetical prote